MGGPPPEHEVSLNTGKQILANLDKKKYLPQPVMVTKTGQWLLPTTTTSRPNLLKSNFNSYRSPTSIVKLAEKSALGELVHQKPDVAFIAMHGSYGEDGTIQGLLESIGLPYTGSGVLASALGMDKPKSLAIFKETGLNVPKFTVLTRPNLYSRDYRGSASIVGWPKVVKPANHGSSVGVHIVRNSNEFKDGVEDAFKYSNRVVIQRFIRGREMTCGVLEDNGKIFPLPPTEIIPKKCAFYDYKSKYDEGGSEHVVLPRNLSDRKIKQIQNAAVKAHSVLGCSGMSRSDFILGTDGKLYILEINTIPGMTRTSLLPEAARAADIDFPKLLDILITNALQKRRVV